MSQGHACRLTSGGYSQNTSRLATKKIAGNKAVSFKLMQERNLPLPKQIVARSENSTVKAAINIGLPVVVKPIRGNKGEGVVINITTSKGVAAAYAEASRMAKAVVVESYIPGEDFRLLVVDGQFIAAVRRIPAKVMAMGSTGSVN